MIKESIPSNLKQISEKQRIEYIDLVKGVSILWVVLLHSCIAIIENYTEIPWYDWLFAPYRMPLFFFISGIFFKIRPFCEFLKKRVKTLAIPFLGFWIIGFLYNTFKYELVGRYSSMDYVGIGSFTDYATSLKGLFYLRPDTDPCIANGALWFLIALFIVQLVHFSNCRFIKNKSIILAIGFILFIASTYLIEHGITGLFYLSNICGLYIFYILGNFWGKNLIKSLENKVGRTNKMLFFCILVFITLSFIPVRNPVLSQVLLFVQTICFFPIVFSICKSINHLNITAPLKYFGRHSLELLVTHIPLLNLINILVFKIMLNLPQEKLFQNAGLYMFVSFFVCIVAEYFFVIKFCNRYLYLFLGKRRNTADS